MIECVGLCGKIGDNTIVQSSTPPQLTGTLTLSLTEGMEPTVRNLMDLQIFPRFRKLECTWLFEEDSQWITALIEEFSGTLERIFIEDEYSYSGSGKPNPTSTMRY